MTATLGLDLGERRIGIAIAEEGDLAARPLTTASSTVTSPEPSTSW